jgi:hypothetical protein
VIRRPGNMRRRHRFLAYGVAGREYPADGPAGCLRLSHFVRRFGFPDLFSFFALSRLPGRLSG